MSKINRVFEIYNEEGLFSLISSIKHFVSSHVGNVYSRYIRMYLPRKKIVYNGVVTQDAKLFDQLVPFRTPIRDYPEYYEYSLVEAIRTHSMPGDHVVVIGGGLGVSTTVAARRIRPTGKVDVYEGARNYVRHINSTIQLNRISDYVEVHHAIVGEALNLQGEAEGANQIQQIPDCDLLVLDCEGAELDILKEMKNSPRMIIVESHGHTGSTPNKLKETLIQKNYNIISKNVAEIEDKEEMCVEREIYVIVAELSI